MKKKRSIKTRIYDAIYTTVPEFTGIQFLEGVNFGLSLGILIWVFTMLIIGW
tara:strand:- start:213 stop:368 length:156 start_codon:yes stop_codon:yes gene_type:complete